MQRKPDRDKMLRRPLGKAEREAMLRQRYGTAMPLSKQAPDSTPDEIAKRDNAWQQH